MKRVTAIISTIAMLAALTGCNNGEIPGGAPENSTGNSATESTDSSESAPESTDNSESAPESSVPEESAPKDEPTFLNCVDGTVINISDITSIQGTVYGVDNKLEQFAIEDFNKERFLKNEYSVTCDGFAYAFTSKDSFNPVQNPELFSAREGFEDAVEYVGEEIAPSSEYYRVEPGDKFGELTVKRAETMFCSNYSNYEGKGIFGAYTYEGMIEFDGELELTGFVRVSKENEGYDEGGDIRFVPDNECVDKIPVMKYEVNEAKGAVKHYPMGNFNGTAYNDINLFSLGNIRDYSDIDLYGLEIGERFTHVKITIGDIVSRGDSSSDIDAKLLSLEKI